MAPAIPWVRLRSKPSLVVLRLEDRRHSVVDAPDKFVGRRSQQRERANPLPLRALPVLPYPGDAERRAVLHRDRVGLLPALSRHPFIEPVDRQDAAAQPVAVPEHRQACDGLALGVDRLSSALWIFAPVWNEAPFQEVERALAGLRVLPDDEQILARASVPAARVIVEPGIADIQSVHERVLDWALGLDDASAHARI